MSHAQIFLSVVSPTSHFSSSCWNSNQIRGEEELKSQVKPNGKVTEHGRRFCINVWMPFLCVSGLIETRKKAQGRRKEPKITFFGEGHLKTLYKEGREDKPRSVKGVVKVPE